MSAASVVLSQTKFSLLSLTRNKQAIIFTIIFPIVLYVLFSSIFGGSDTTDVPGAGSLELNAYFAAGMIAYALTGASFTTSTRRSCSAQSTSADAYVIRYSLERSSAMEAYASAM